MKKMPRRDFKDTRHPQLESIARRLCARRGKRAGLRPIEPISERDQIIYDKLWNRRERGGNDSDTGSS
jgi:hypothetical protein